MPGLVTQNVIIKPCCLGARLPAVGLTSIVSVLSRLMHKASERDENSHSVSNSEFDMESYIVG